MQELCDCKPSQSHDGFASGKGTIGTQAMLFAIDQSSSEAQLFDWKRWLTTFKSPTQWAPARVSRQPEKSSWYIVPKNISQYRV